MAKTILLAALLLLGVSAWAKVAAPAAADPLLEQHVMAIAGELRCLVCQNQTVAESDSDLAKDLRDQVREKLKAGQSDREIIDYMIARYGDFVLWRPPFKSTTLLLWLGPGLLLVIGLVVLFRRLSNARDAAETELSAAERARAARLLELRGETEET